MYRNFLKIIIGRSIAFIALIILSPLLLVIAFLIKLDSNGKVIFKQRRLGKNGKKFIIYKFRTMIENSENIGTKYITYEGDPRITKVGKLLRNTSIDELPQLFNIIKGDMCIIGPRPMLLKDPWPYDEYPDKYKKRYSVLPGLFCLVDTIYRAEASRELQFELDVEYVNKMCFKLDVNIFYKTFFVVLQQKNVYSSANAKDILKKDEIL